MTHARVVTPQRCIERGDHRYALDERHLSDRCRLWRHGAQPWVARIPDPGRPFIMMQTEHLLDLRHDRIGVCHHSEHERGGGTWWFLSVVSASGEVLWELQQSTCTLQSGLVTSDRLWLTCSRYERESGREAWAVVQLALASGQREAVVSVTGSQACRRSPELRQWLERHPRHRAVLDAESGLGVVRLHAVAKPDAVFSMRLVDLLPPHP